jgi:hypothetical protein
MKSGKKKPARRRAVSKNEPAPAPIPKTAKSKPKSRVNEHLKRTTLRSRIVTEGRLATILATIDSVVWSIAADTFETRVP